MVCFVRLFDVQGLAELNGEKKGESYRYLSKSDL